MIKVYTLWSAVVASLLLLGCGEARQEDTAVSPEVKITHAEWQGLVGKRILFGHQSVGQNILDGIRVLADDAQVTLPIVESRDAGARGGITHFFVGNNQDPTSKLRDFTAALESDAARAPDIALVKLCYIDFDADSDAKAIAEEYIGALDDLSRRYPSTTFVAMTAPLTAPQTGPKALIKRLLGRPVSGYADNARRQEFNDILRSRYKGQGELFDLAGIEDEGAAPFEYEGRRLEVLNEAFTNDGGHLNAPGAQIVAARLIRYLAAVPARSSAVP